MGVPVVTAMPMPCWFGKEREVHPFRASTLLFEHGDRFEKRSVNW
jgi:hypothetical protein